VTCAVEDVRLTDAAAAASVHCVGDGGDVAIPSHPRGIFVATADGLWQTCEGHCKQGIEDLAGLVSTLTPKARLFTTTPAPGQAEWISSDDGAAIVQTVAQLGSRWCITTTRQDGSGWRLCLAEGKGIVGGRGFDAAHKPAAETVFGDAPPL
jgi:hypothetical protein